MTVRCANCGEEMLGAVNRCWQCGQTLVANAEEPSLPPQRRPVQTPTMPLAAQPTVRGPVAEAEIVDNNGGNATATIDESGEAQGEQSSDLPPVRTSSPPAAVSSPQPVPRSSSAPVASAADAYRHPRHHPTSATGGALGSLLLGVISLVVSWFTVVGALLSICGLGLGAWGVSSNRRETAMVGMLLCCIALLIAGYTGAVAAYEEIYGYSPWESSMPAEFIDPQAVETID